MSNLSLLQKWLKENNIDVFIVPRTDEFLSEYIASYAERLKWVSNFSGSAGYAIIMQDTAVIFVDGRYTEQVKQQVNKNDFVIEHFNNFSLWLKKNLHNKLRIGIDPFLHSKNNLTVLLRALNIKDKAIIYLKNNPIDLLWKEQPARPNSKAFIHKLSYSGKRIVSKIKEIKKILKSNDCDYYILTALDSIAWLLNLRGDDVLYFPINLAYVIITPDKKVELFIDKKKISSIRNDLAINVNFNDFEKINYFILNIPKQKTIGIDKIKTPIFFENICKRGGLKFKYINDPCLYPKAQKNKIELNGARLANLRDGISMTKFLYWLKNEMIIKDTNEIIASQKLFSFRKNNELFYSLSFDTISAIGKHAALPHYHVTKQSNQQFQNNSIYLVDSGAQYFDGTTDITRTIIIGQPTIEHKDRFTRVLKGHIALASINFKIGTKGSTLDSLARKSLQEIGCDYDHGTGHGIGSFLCVHEGPQRIAKSQKLSNNQIKENMILSNEPGFYQKNQYGIRIENLVITKKNKNNNLFFETITLAPIDTNLLEIRLLTKKELLWINKYHQRVYDKLSNHLTIVEKKWLRKVTQPIN